MPPRPWKDGRWVEVFPDGSAQTFKLGTPAEEQRGTAKRDTFEDIKLHTSDEWQAMNPKEEPKPEGEETPAEEPETPAEQPEVPAEEKPAKARRARK